jgi:hypothetical protein
MVVPRDKQEDFRKYSVKTLGPTWKKFGCQRYELYKVNDQPFIKRLVLESNRFVEQLMFNDETDIAEFFRKVKNNPDANKISRSYEEIFDATNIELRLLLKFNS